MSKLGNVNVRKNTGAPISSRNRLNLIEGAGVSLTILDDDAGDEVDITITSASQWLDQFFPAATPDSHKGAYAAILLPDGEDTTIYQTFMIPNDITTITTAHIKVIPEGTGNLRWQCDTAMSACGEDFETHTDSIGADVTAVTTDEHECIDISDALTDATGGDLVGIQFIRTGSNAGDTVDADAFYLGILIQGVV